MFIDLPPWAARAKCLDADPDIFFGEPGDPAINAKRICSICSVREPCLEWALDNDERHGVFGGLSPRERQNLKRRRRRRLAS
jgi:WhiB family transcriptional regulator, redox-sensing transcriptional regulator